MKSLLDVGVGHDVVVPDPGATSKPKGARHDAVGARERDYTHAEITTIDERGRTE
jgi:hypothetical protein